MPSNTPCEIITGHQQILSTFHEIHPALYGTTAVLYAVCFCFMLSSIGLFYPGCSFMMIVLENMGLFRVLPIFNVTIQCTKIFLLCSYTCLFREKRVQTDWSKSKEESNRKANQNMNPAFTRQYSGETSLSK